MFYRKTILPLGHFIIVVSVLYTVLHLITVGSTDRNPVRSRCYGRFDRLIDNSTNSNHKLKLVQAQIKICSSTSKSIKSFWKNFSNVDFHKSKPFVKQAVANVRYVNDSGAHLGSQDLTESESRLTVKQATIIILVIFIPVYCSVLFVLIPYFIYVWGSTSHPSSNKHFQTLDAVEPSIHHLHVHLSKQSAKKGKGSDEPISDSAEHNSKAVEEKLTKLGKTTTTEKVVGKHLRRTRRPKRKKKLSKRRTRFNETENIENKARTDNHNMEIAAETIGVIAESLHVAGYKLGLANVIFRIFEEEILQGGGGGGEGEGERYDKNGIENVLTRLKGSVTDPFGKTRVTNVTQLINQYLSNSQGKVVPVSGINGTNTS